MSESTVNKHEAPTGFYAVAKASLPKNKGNLCCFCEWRVECCSSGTDFEDSNNRCMSYPIVSFKTGKTIKRSDGRSVIFKKVKNDST